jgi:hypothetical protein
MGTKIPRDKEAEVLSLYQVAPGCAWEARVFPAFGVWFDQRSFGEIVNGDS